MVWDFSFLRIKQRVLNKYTIIFYINQLINRCIYNIHISNTINNNSCWCTTVFSNKAENTLCFHIIRNLSPCLNCICSIITTHGFTFCHHDFFSFCHINCCATAWLIFIYNFPIIISNAIRINFFLGCIFNFINKLFGCLFAITSINAKIKYCHRIACTSLCWHYSDIFSFYWIS